MATKPIKFLELHYTMTQFFNNNDYIPPQTEGAHQNGPAGFSDVQHVTSLAKDRIDHDGGSTIEPPFEVNTFARGSYRISLHRVVTNPTSGSVAWKCS